MKFSERNLRRCQAPNGFNHQLDSWSLNDWITATLGELGEAANVSKKLKRIEDGIPGNKQTKEELLEQLKQEIGDTACYLDLLAQRAGFDLETVRDEAFERKSKEIGYVDKGNGIICFRLPGTDPITAGEILRTFKRRLEETKLWNLHGPDILWELNVAAVSWKDKTPEQGWSIGLRTEGVYRRDLCARGNTYFDVNITGKTFYLLDIGLVKSLRGKGYGTELYETLEKIAKDLGCKRIEQTPSGYTYREQEVTDQIGRDGKLRPYETRAKWLMRRGWTRQTSRWTRTGSTSGLQESLIAIPIIQ